MGYTAKTNDPNYIYSTIKIDGQAADLVRDKINDVKNKSGVKMYGVNLAIQSLLCELYRIKKGISPKSQQDQV